MIIISRKPNEYKEKLTSFISSQTIKPNSKYQEGFVLKAAAAKKRQPLCMWYMWTYATTDNFQFRFHFGCKVSIL